jgi:uncharacterized membrane protein YedE/YeeE
MDLIPALALGVGFGFFLERGGLGSARKLTAQFYLNDLTVFKVMFTAIVTAMLGLFWLGRAGLVDLAQIPLSPTFLAPQVVGGLLFGAGFVIGGYCPGTSCVAAASGKLDGVLVFIGMMAGIVIFAESYGVIRDFANATSLGRLSLVDLLGIKPGLLAGLVTLAALVAFRLADRIERARGSRLVQPE